MSQIFRKKLQGSLSISSFKNDYSKNRKPDFSSLQTDEEKKELTLQLVMIRKAYDNTLNENSQKRSHIELLKKEIKKLQASTVICSEDQSTISVRINSLQNQLDSLKIKLEEEQQANKTYEHMLSRMKLTSNDLILKSSDLHDKLGTFKRHLSSYLQKSRKTKEESIQSQRYLRKIKEDMRVDRKNKKEFIKSLEIVALNKKEASIRREIRAKKQAEIAEIAANEDRNVEEIRLRQEIILHKLYYMYLMSKRQKKFENSYPAFKAFTKIQIITGMASIKKITDFFLKKHEKQEKLKKIIAENENQLDLLKQKHKKIKSDLKKIILTQQETFSPFSKDMKDLEINIDKEKKYFETAVEDKSKYTSLYRQVEQAGKRFSAYLELKNNNDILQQYQEITEYIKNSCSEINNSKEKFQKELEEKNSKDILSLYKSLHPTKIAKPSYLNENNIDEEES